MEPRDDLVPKMMMEMFKKRRKRRSGHESDLKAEPVQCVLKKKRKNGNADAHGARAQSQEDARMFALCYEAV